MNSIIFIGSSLSPQKTNKINSYKQLFLVSFNEILIRIFTSFVPPIVSRFRKVYIDLLGPLIAFISLSVFISYGYMFKNFDDQFSYEPFKSVLFFVILMPIICFILLRNYSKISFYEIVSLIGYSLYGHLFTLVCSSFFDGNNFVFFIFLIIFGGLSTLRVIIIFLSVIQLPVVRLLICSLISIVNILYLIFLHFIYMHRTFVYNYAN